MEKETLGQMLKRLEQEDRNVYSKTNYILVRVDGKAFHNYTKNLNRPYDSDYMEAIDYTMKRLCETVPGTRLGYCQSDEISLLVTAFKNIPVSDSNPEGLQVGELWMGGVQNKLVSLTAAYASVYFNEKRAQQGYKNTNPAVFDSRVWAHPGDEEGLQLVQKYFMWRQIDAKKNSIHMAADTIFGHKKLLKKTTTVKQEMLRENNTPWEDMPEGFQYGRMAYQVSRLEPVTFVDKRTGETKEIEALRNSWKVKPADDLKEKTIMLTPKVSDTEKEEAPSWKA